MKKHLLPSLILITINLVAAPLWAQTLEEKGLAIATETDLRDTGFGDFKAEMGMLLRNKQGEESQRFMRTRTLEGSGDGDKTMIIFDRPRDVKGTALLTYTHKNSSDDQWLYLPALKRVKRIASRNKSGPFMGSEFAYEDLSSQEVEKYTYKFVEDTELEGVPMFLIERDPVDKYSGYTRQLVWINKTEYRPERIEFYDRKNSLLKTLVFRKYQKYLDQFWRAEEMYMENHQTGKNTLLTWKDYKFRNGYSEGDFKKNSLKRAK